MGANSFFRKLTDIHFTIKNLSKNKCINVFNCPINPGQTKDLLALPEISEADIRHSLIKGELANLIRLKVISIESSSIDLDQSDPSQAAFITSGGFTPSLEKFIGEISTIDGVGSQTLSLQNTFYAFNQWTNNERDLNVLPDYTNGTITIQTTGTYLTTCNLSLQSGNNLDLKVSLFVNGTLHSNASSRITTGTSNPYSNVVISDVNKYDAGDILDIRISCTNSSGVSVTVRQANFFVVSI